MLITFIRHGESTDNLKQAWAGWRDAPLSVHGHDQALRLASYLSDPYDGQEPPMRFHTVYASTLKRAAWTAQAVHDAHPDPKPPLVHSDLLWERHFGEAEGKAWPAHSSAPGYSLPRGRTTTFPGGESLEDVSNRAKRFIDQFLVQHIRSQGYVGGGSPVTEQQEPHIAIVAHGIIIAEIIYAIRARAQYAWPAKSGLSNTGYSRIRVLPASMPSSRVQSPRSSSPTLAGQPSSFSIPADAGAIQEAVSDSTGPAAAQDLDPAEEQFYLDHVENQDTSPAGGWSDPHTTAPEPTAGTGEWTVRTLFVNRKAHLEGLERQAGGIGSAAYDPKQQTLKAFFKK